jgi:hypothetical protein
LVSVSCRDRPMRWAIGLFYCGGVPAANWCGGPRDPCVQGRGLGGGRAGWSDHGKESRLADEAAGNHVKLRYF